MTDRTSMWAEQAKGLSAGASIGEGGPVSFGVDRGIGTNKLVKTAKNILKARTKVFRVLPRHVFHDDAWDMLLELFIGRHERKTTFVKHLLLSAASPTSGMRRIDALEAADLVIRDRLGHDHRCISVDLTERGMTAMTILLQDIVNDHD